MDLESPGVHSFFRCEGADFQQSDGLLEFLEECQTLPGKEPDARRRLVRCTHPYLIGTSGTIRLLLPGNLTRDYSARLSRFSWDRFYRKREGYRFMELLRQQLTDCGADHVLIDSRTGATDVGTVCTFQLPDLVLVFFALHEQGILGAERVARAIVDRRGGQGERSKRVVLVPSRVDETGASECRDEWMARARAHLAGIADDFLKDVGQRIPHVSEAAFGEYLVDPSRKDNYLARAYENLTRFVAGETEDASFSPKAPDLLAACEEVLAAMEEGLRATMDGSIDVGRAAAWGSRIQERHSTLVRQVDALNAQLWRLRTAIGEVQPEPPATPVTAPGWRLFLEALRAELRRLTTAAARFVVETARQVLGLADAKDDTLNHSLGLLRGGDITGFLNRWPEALERLRSNSPRKKLHELEISLAEFQSWYSDADLTDRVDQLLREQLDQFEGQLPAPEDRTLKNLLYVALELGVRPNSLHWSAYDFARMVVADRPELDRALFERVGAMLWGESWAQALQQLREGVIGVDIPAGLEARRQLQALFGARDGAPKALHGVVRRVAPELVTLWRGGYRDAIRAVLRRWSDNPCILWATVEASSYGDDGGDVALPLTAALLEAQDAAGVYPSPALQYRLADLLVARGDLAEAFYALCAGAERTPEVLEESGFAPIATGFALLAWSQRRNEALEDLLIHDAFAGRVAATLAGTIWLAWIAAGFDEHPWPSSIVIAVWRAVAASPHLDAGPAEVVAWVRERRNDTPDAVRLVLQWAALRQGIEEAINGVTVHNTWGPASRYEAAFKKYWRGHLRPYMDPASGPPAKPLDMSRLIVDDVVRLVQQERRDIDRPVDAAFNSLASHFNRVRDLAGSLRDVMEQMPDVDRRRALDRAREAERVRTGFATWAAGAQGQAAAGWDFDGFREQLFGGGA